MLLCIDIGNTDITCAVFAGEKIVRRFRHPVAEIKTFALPKVKGITKVALVSVVPGATEKVKRLYKDKGDIFELSAATAGTLKIKYKYPARLGPDRIAAAIGAVHAFPGKNIIVADMGTATTFGAVSAQKEFLGGLILPGLGTQKTSLLSRAAKLAGLDPALAPQKKYLGRTTEENISRGLYFGHLGAIKEIAHGLSRECFAGQKTVLVATGGFSRLYKNAGVFDAVRPDLVLEGLRIACLAWANGRSKKAEHEGVFIPLERK